MHKIFFLIISTFLVNTSVFAQHKNAIQWGGTMARPTSNSEYYYIGNWPDGIMSYFYAPSTVFAGAKAFIERYDNYSMLPQFTKPVLLNTAKATKALEIEAFEQIGEHPIMFASHYNKEKNKIEVYARRYTTEGEPVGLDYKLADFDAKRRSNVNQLRIVPNSNRELVLIHYSKLFEKYQNEKAEFRIFDKDLNLLYDRFIEFPYKERNFSVYRATVDAYGRVYLLVKILLEKDEITARGLPRYRYSLVTFGNDNRKVEEYNLQMDNYFTSDISFSENNGRIICAGFYSEISSDRAAGSFYIEIDLQRQEIVEKKIDKFEKSFVVDFIPNRRARRMTEIPDFKVDHVLQFSDGSSAIVGEQFYIEEICFRDFRTGMINCQYNYNYNNIIVIKYDDRGSVMWTANIPKYQQSSNDGGKFLSYTFGLNENELIFLFNDHPKNINPTDNRVGIMTNVRKSIPVMVKLSKEGNYSRTPLSYERVQKMFIVPMMSHQISPSSAMIMAVRNTRYKIGFVNFDFHTDKY